MAMRRADSWDPAKRKFLRPSLCKALHKLGRKNYLFAGSHQAAQRAAMIYSLLGTCKVNGVNPLHWLRDILEKLPTHPVNRIEQLLPHLWEPQL